MRITPDFNRYAEGSVLVEFGETKVICTASVESKVPPFLEGQRPGLGHRRVRHAAAVTHTRSGRSPRRSRAKEIQRLIGRALRAAVDMKRSGQRTITVDCDVIQADGGTRTAADHRRLGGAGAGAAAAGASGVPTETHALGVAAVSTGIVNGEARLDLRLRGGLGTPTSTSTSS